MNDLLHGFFSFFHAATNIHKLAPNKMNFFEMAKNVDSKESFLLFVQALAEDAERAAAEPELTADGKLNLSPGGWENATPAAFLAAMSAWANANSANTGNPLVPEQPTWSAFAQILHSGKFYE